MMTRKHRLFLGVSVWRALAETWLLGAIGFLTLLLGYEKLLDVVLGQANFFLVVVVTLWYALRYRTADKKMLWSIVKHELGAMVLLCPVAVGLWWGLIRALGLHTVIKAIEYVPGSFLLLAVMTLPILGASRLALYIWVSWLDLRRRHLMWALTHIQLQLILTLGAVVFFVGGVGIVLSSRSSLGDLDTWVRTILPFAGVAGVSAIFAVIGVLPPAAAIAWLTARKMTRRLEALTEATAAVRYGNTAVRILVDGEDEVAQLQTDFNAMAIALEQAITALQAERDKVASLLDARRQLVAGVSHELRTPLATLRSYLESLQQAPVTDAVHHDLDVMSRELTRLQTLVDDLFTLSRAEVNGLTLELRCVDLRELVTRQLDAMAPLAWQRNRVQIVADPSAGSLETGTRARVDAGRTEQILVNLLRNALRHTPPGGIIAVSLEMTADELCLCVCNTGAGIAADDLPHIWERFYRGSDARACDAHGAGLGLSLVKELTEAMQGHVAVQNRPGEGACFRVWFPLCK